MWGSAPNLNTARYALGVATAPCSVPSMAMCLYAIGGCDSNGNNLASVESYDPSSGLAGSWTTSTPSLIRGRGYPDAAAAPCPSSNPPSPSNDLCLYIAGGIDGSTHPESVLSETEYYAAGTPTAVTLTRARARRSDSHLVVSWRLSVRSGVVGFTVYAAGHELTHRLVPVHASSRYHVALRTERRGRVTIHVLLRGGSWAIVPVR